MIHFRSSVAPAHIHVLSIGTAIVAMALMGCKGGGDSDLVVQDMGASATVSAMKKDVEILTSDTFEGRETGQPGAYAAGEWLAGRMAQLGLSAAGDSGFFQTFRYKPHPPMQVHGQDMKTMGMAVVGEIVGRNVLGATAPLADTAQRWGVIGCHHDHLGWGDENSLWRGVEEGDSTLHPGADDNASGVATVLELASRHAASPLADHPLLMASFSGEEKGLWGSNHFTDEPTVGLTTLIG